ncbi:hypothetical protein ANO14919_140650 [Xylariales sp. No.14919]|nr:hypothetical protein ANO14919_140650 [Xylariales sp. No.14919]
MLANCGEMILGTSEASRETEAERRDEGAHTVYPRA